jgi:signal-transduction protein with cAMP-binding, CBS, and nucleotidyltransferase domain
MATVGRIDRVVKRKGKVLTIPEQATIKDAANTMREQQVGALVVVNEKNEVVGILTERDIVVQVVASAKNPGATRVADCMTHHVVSCTLNSGISKARSLMAKHGIRHLPIVEDGVAVGMISSRDILAHELEASKAVIRQQGFVLQELERTYPGITRLKVSTSGRIVI